MFARLTGGLTAGAGYRAVIVQHGLVVWKYPPAPLGILQGDGKHNVFVSVIWILHVRFSHYGPVRRRWRENLWGSPAPFPVTTTGDQSGGYCYHLYGSGSIYPAKCRCFLRRAAVSSSDALSIVLLQCCRPDKRFRNSFFAKPVKP
jgi:hypothetical protein